MDDDNNEDGAGEEAEVKPESLVFPTSARPVFRQMMLLGAAILALCFLTYSCGGEEEADPIPEINNPLPF